MLSVKMNEKIKQNQGYLETLTEAVPKGYTGKRMKV